MGFINTNLNNINLSNDNFDEGHPETINYVRVMTWHKKN